MINETNKHSWCVNACHAISGNNDGSTKLCCMYRNNSPEFKLGKESLLDHYNKQEFIEVRNALDSGVRHPNCTLCWQEEDAGRTSKRQRDNAKYERRLQLGKEPYNGLAYLELNLGNTCNLSCRTCCAPISSGWMKEEYATSHATTKTYKEFADSLKVFHQSYDEESTFWKDLDNQLMNVKQFDFYGGEPLMIKKMWETLRKATEKNVAHDIELHYNTNGTHFPKEVELWKNFKEINLSFSIDGIGDQFEYMRYPAKWNHVLDNMKKFHELSAKHGNMNLSWCITLSVTNIHYVKETVEFYHEHFGHNTGMYLNLVHGPRHHNIQILPDAVKEEVIKKLNTVPKEIESAWHHIPGVINFMKNSKYDEKEFLKFKQVTESSDIYRNQSFKETFKEYAEIISNV